MIKVKQEIKLFSRFFQKWPTSNAGLLITRLILMNEGNKLCYLFQVCALLWYGAEPSAFPWKGPSLCQLTVWRSFWRCSDLTYHKQCTVPSTEDHPHLHNIYILWRYLSNSGPSMSKWEPKGLNISDKTVLDMSFCDFDRIESYHGKRDWLLSMWVKFNHSESHFKITIV